MISIASHNGLNATTRAFELLKEGHSPTHACVEGVTLVEDDPLEHTVGYGGLPNEQGIMELDAAVMDGPTHRAGAVVGLRDIRHAARLARLVMEQTHRVMIAGEGAKQFALQQGFAEEDLLTDKAREMWMYWKRRLASSGDDWLQPAEDPALDLKVWFEKHFYGSHGGTIHCSGLDAKGSMACVTTTSGHAFKMPGRVGDSPIIGAGLYVDNSVGSCGAIGYGESTMQNCTSFLGVELMRSGMSPLDAGLESLRRVAEKTVPAKRVGGDAAGDPNFDLQLFLLARDGSYAGVAMRGEKKFAVSDSDGDRLENCISLL